MEAKGVRRRKGAKRMECAELAPAFEPAYPSDSGSKLRALQTLRAVRFAPSESGRMAVSNGTPGSLSLLRIYQRHVPRHVPQHLGDDMICGDAFGFGLEIQNQTVAKCGGGDGFDVVEADVETTLDESADFAGQDERLSAARAAAKTEILRGYRRGGFGLGIRGQRETPWVNLSGRGPRGLAHPGPLLHSGGACH